MREFLLGATAALAFVVALFFLRFWRQTRDRLFAYFAVAFVLLAANWTALAFIPAESESRPLAYLVRLVAFALILVGVIDKNRASR
jgi:hypothetical protein